MTLFISAFILGLAGSFHCAGMCGPIALTLPLPGSTLLSKIYGGLLYNGGRTITYALMGALFGLIGQGFHLIGFQQVISVVMGVIMILLVLFPGFFGKIIPAGSCTTGMVARLKSGFSRLLSVRNFRSLLFIGLLNGLLPCGLVYMAVAGAIAAGNVASGALYMLFFGLGTIPMLLFISLMGNLVTATLRNRINRLIPVLVCIVGVLFILRGLNLGIPYLSPTKEKIEKKFEKSLEEKKATASCGTNSSDIIQQYTFV